MRIVPVILSGGIGSRLWPLSRSTVPKQLQRLLGDHTMVQATALRVAGMEGVGRPLVVCNQAHVEAVIEQLTAVGVPPSVVVAEPVGRNTAAAVAAAAWLAEPDCVLLVLPADHVVSRVDAFREAVLVAASAAEEGSLVTFGIVPGRPETGYGYIKSSGNGGVRRVERFVEKPDAETAARYLQEGTYLWNSGMFVFTPEVVLAELGAHAPEVMEAVRQSLDEARRAAAGVVHPSPSFVRAPSLSFDHAVMEHTDRAVVVPLDAGWSDVGSWATLWEIEERDEDDNVVRGEAEVLDVRRSYVRSAGRLVAVVGLDDVVVVDTGDAVLVAARDRVQDVRAVVERLAARGRPEVD